MRERLPGRRENENESIVFAGIEIEVSIGFNDVLLPMEVFLSTKKVGSATDVSARDTAVLISLLLQYGCSATVIERSLTADETGAPEGLAGKIVAMIIARQKEMESAA